MVEVSLSMWRMMKAIEVTLTQSAVQLLHKSVSDSYKNWSGGHPDEQMHLEELRNELYKCLLEFQMID